MFIDMRGAEWTEKDAYRQQPDAKRFEDWEFAYSTVIGTKTSIEYCRNIGEDKIWQQVKLLAGITRNKLSEIERVKILDRGAEKGVGWAIRVSPHYYNTISEIEIFIEALKEIIKIK